MYTLQIYKTLTKHVKYFQGVYPIDLLPSTFIKPSIIIINLDKHYMPDSHWVAVSFSDSGYAEYFDSYGLPPIKQEIIAYLQPHTVSWTFNGTRLQGLTSNVCGHYCRPYAQHRALGLSMTSFLDMFEPARYNCNDITAVRMFRAQFKRCPGFRWFNQQQQPNQTCRPQHI